MALKSRSKLYQNRYKFHGTAQWERDATGVNNARPLALGDELRPTLHVELASPVGVRPVRVDLAESARWVRQDRATTAPATS